MSKNPVVSPSKTAIGLPCGVVSRDLKGQLKAMKEKTPLLIVDLAGSSPRTHTQYSLLLQARGLLGRMEGVQRILDAPIQEKFRLCSTDTTVTVSADGQTVTGTTDQGGLNGVFGSGVYGVGLGYKSVKWHVKKTHPESDSFMTPSVVVGVVCVDAHTGSPMCEKGSGMYGWCDEEGRMVFGNGVELERGEWDDKEPKDDLIIEGEQGCVIELNCVKGTVSVTRLSDAHTHTQPHSQSTP
eukprot:GDKI01020610.1.p1 GENE.GDKI01020610.1~~GDKI01020610.1.p1  ORF type:complete len:240 (+),score=77.45 GDKI01020610.1:119-838(+)